MRLTGFHAEGMGVLHDTGASDLPPGLTVVTGPNGAGKSSLHALLVRVLFSFPRRNAADQVRHLDPVRDGRHGGTVHALDGEARPWSVTRIRRASGTALEVEGPHGPGTTAADLVPLLGDLDGDTFQQLFAIDLDRLTSTADLPPEELNQLLFDSSILANAGTIRAAIDLADERADVLHRIGGRTDKRVVRALDEERKELERQLRDARAAAGDVGRLQGERDELVVQRTQLDRRLREVRAELAVLDLVQRAWEPTREAAEARRLAAELPDVDEATLAPAAVARLREDLGRAEQEVERLERERRDLAQERDGLVVDDRLADVAEQVTRLHAGLDAHREHSDRATALEGTVAHRRDEAEQAVAQVGPGWTAQRVAEVRVDGAAVTLLERAGDELVAARSAVDDRDEGVAAGERAVEAARSDHARAADEVEEVDLEALVADEEALRTLTDLAPLLRQAAIVAADRARAAEQATAGAPTSATSPLPGIGIAGLGLVVVLVGLVLPAVAAAAAGAVLAAVGAFLWGRAAAGSAAPAAQAPASLPPATTADDLARAQQAVAEAAGRLGLQVPPSQEAIVGARTRVEQRRQHAEQQRRAAVEVERLARELDGVAGQLREAEALRDRAAGRRDEAEEAWRRACDEVGVSGDDPEAVRRLHRRVADAVRALRAAEESATEAQELRAAVGAWADDAAEVVRAAGREAATPHDAVLALPALHTAVTADATTRRRCEELDAALARVDGQLEDARGEVQRLQDELRSRRRAAGVADDDAFDRLVERARQRAAQEARAAECDARVAAVLGEGGSAERARALLDDGDVAAWDVRRTELAAAEEELEQQRVDLIEQATQVRGALDDLLTDGTVPDLAQQVRMLEEELAENLRTWARLRLASGFMQSAVDAYEARQQPVVLDDASRWLASFTHGTLTAVRQVDRHLQALRADGRRVPATDLSTGEQAQLYLALRVALADQTDPAMPLLLDDLLSTSDDDRAEAIVRSLAAMADQRQVLLFTPSERTVAAMADAIPDLGVVRLEDGRVVDHPGLHAPSAHDGAAPQVPPTLDLT